MAITKPLTKKEQAWIARLEKVLLNPPTDRLGLYTIGDCSLSVYDRTRTDEIDEYQQDNNGGDFCLAVEHFGADLGEVKTEMNIETTSG
jgi:hypothetical protein